MVGRRVGPPVVVVGLGVMGASVLWALAREGVPAVGVDGLPPGHDGGGSHGGSRLVRRLHWEGAHYPAAAARAQGLYRELERESGDSLLETCPQLVVGPSGGPLVARTAAIAVRTGTPHDHLSARDARREHPGLRVDDHETVLRDPDATVVRPERAVRAMVECALALGAETVHGRVTAVVGPGGVPCVTLDGVALEARAVVVATGSALGTDGPVAAVPGVEPRRAVQAWFRTAPEHQPLVVGAAWPAVVRQVGPRRFWSLPDVDGRGVKVGGPSAPSPERPATVDTAQLRAVEDVVGDWFPGLVPHAVAASTASDGYAPDAGFVVGPSAVHPEVVVCGGLSGHGFSHAPVLGAVVAARLAASSTTAAGRPLVPHDELAAFDRVVADRFSPDRPALHRAAARTPDTIPLEDPHVV
jgi:sarcosine oxidase